MNMKYENVKMIELCPLVFIAQEDLDKVSIKGLEEKGRLLPFFKAARVVDNFIEKYELRNQIHQNIYAECNVNNMVEIRGLDDPFDIIKIFKLCKKTFKEVKLGVYLDDFITVNEKEINFIDLDSEKDFWPKVIWD